MRGRPSKIVNDVLGHCVFRWQAALRPEIPAPTITTEKCSTNAFALQVIVLEATLMNWTLRVLRRRNHSFVVRSAELAGVGV